MSKEVLERLRAVEHRSLENEQALARVFDEGYDPASQSQEIHSLKSAVGDLQTENIRVKRHLDDIETALSPEEKCLVMMYRYLISDPATPRRLVATSDGDMQMGQE